MFWLLEPAILVYQGANNSSVMGSIPTEDTYRQHPHFLICMRNNSDFMKAGI